MSDKEKENTHRQISFTLGTFSLILQSTDYYAYGLPYNQYTNQEVYGNEPIQIRDNKYQYNGIELIDDFGLTVNHALYRTLDPQLGRWWQIDPKAEEFYGWSAYHSNLGNPILYKDPEGDTPTLGPALVAAFFAAVVDVAFQLASTGEVKGESVAISAGAAFATVVTAGIINPVTTGGAVAVGATVGGVMGAGESALKQTVIPETGPDGNPVPFSASKVVTDGVISSVTAGHGEAAQQIFKKIVASEPTKKIVKQAGENIINVSSEVNENAGQNIVQSTKDQYNKLKDQNNKPKPQNTKPPTTKPTPNSSGGGQPPMNKPCNCE